VDIASQVVDVNRSLAHRFVLSPELFLLLPDLFALLWRPLGLRRTGLELTGSRLQGIGLLRCSEQQNRDEWDHDHRVLRKAVGMSGAIAGAKTNVARSSQGSRIAYLTAQVSQFAQASAHCAQPELDLYG
jgi:hypothetical protein